MYVVIKNPTKNDKSTKIGEGSYGCIYNPGLISFDKILKCYKNENDLLTDSEKLQKKTLNNYISKVVFKEEHYKEEYAFLTIFESIDKENCFTLEHYLFYKDNTKNYINCNHDFKITDKDCNKYNEKIENNESIEQFMLHIENGGENLKKNITISPQIILNFLNGINIMINKEIIHNDIKPENILFNTQKLYLIDFSLTIDKDDVFSYERMGILKHKNDYYPPEFIIIYYMYVFIIFKFIENKLDFTFFMKKNDIIEDIFRNHLNDDQNDRNIYYTDLINIINLELNKKNLLKNEDYEYKNSEDKKIKKNQKLKDFHKIINTIFDYKKIDIYSLGVTFEQINLNLDIKLMKHYDFRKRCSIDQVITQLSLYKKGGKEPVSTKTPQTPQTPYTPKTHPIIISKTPLITEEMKNQLENEIKEYKESYKLRKLENAEKIAKKLGISIKLPENILLKNPNPKYGGMKKQTINEKLPSKTQSNKKMKESEDKKSSKNIMNGGSKESDKKSIENKLENAKKIANKLGISIKLPENTLSKKTDSKKKK